jgi:enamine deaminase RidA (YjgF/YER057c/UK114 family)
MRGPEGEVHYPVMTAVQVLALMEARAKVEIEATAVIPDA